MSEHQDDRCDPQQLRDLLDDLLGDPERSLLEEHLERCPGCRERLEALAAGSRWWRDARRLRLREQDEEIPGDGPAVPVAAGPDPADSPIDLLSPSEDPAFIGRLGPYGVFEEIGRGG